MATLRRFSVMAGLALVVSVFLVACGGVQTSGNTNMSSNNSMSANTQMGDNGTSTAYTTPTTQPTMGMNPTATPAMNNNNNGNMGAFIHVAVVTLNKNKVHVLTTNKGFMLYYYMKDHMFTSNCTGMCAQNWPPLLAPKGMMTVDSSTMLPKKLSVHQTANGEQVFYDGHALYTYAGDMQPGQFNGRGEGMVWYLVGITL